MLAHVILARKVLEFLLFIPFLHESFQSFTELTEFTMTGVEKSRTTYLKKLLLVTYGTGIVAGILFPWLVVPFFGRQALSPLFYILCLLMGLGVGTILYQFIRISLKRQLQKHLHQLQHLAPNVTLKGNTVEELDLAVQSSVSQVENLLTELLQTIKEMSPHYQALANSSRFLSSRAKDGLQAALNTRQDIQSMEDKQQEITGQMEVLAERTESEAAISRQLSASLEETANAMDHTNAQFLETTTSVDEMASSTREVAQQALAVAQTVEGTAHDLDTIGDSLARIRAGAFNSAQAANTVKIDAESGLEIVHKTMQEMERIDEEGQKSLNAMARLSEQTVMVEKIIEVIKELVSDTELLAFNAAIIAAKAGEEGKGFSVVAEEIRDLADRTTTSASDIQRIVKTISTDTQEVLQGVVSTSHRISAGKQLSQEAGEALRKIAFSSKEAAETSQEIAELTGQQEERARSLLDDASTSLRSVQVIARSMNEQQAAIMRIQHGVNEMKAAADRISHAMDEQVKANREFNQGLMDREEQIHAVNQATLFQQEAAHRVISHFNTSENRLKKNVERAETSIQNIAALEKLDSRLWVLAKKFSLQGGEGKSSDGEPSRDS